MFEKFLLLLIIVIAFISFTSADFSCFFGDTICKSITCRNAVQWANIIHLPVQNRTQALT
ncbi:unnamed protein product [Strongylus vulgaris]|uniref:Saposin A-type domain-containing protein n=1 Tax=Strongylus vulgaris TaxID=40348 RepID=A0A3P7K4T7_STRVU|nr:unnamed protein product [Strongylus vulgaris]